MEQRKAKCVCLLFIATHLYLFSYATCFCIYLFSTLQLVLLSCVSSLSWSHNLLVYSSYTCCTQHGISIILLNTENYRQFSTGGLLRVRCFIVMCTLSYVIYPEFLKEVLSTNSGFKLHSD